MLNTFTVHYRSRPICTTK